MKATTISITAKCNDLFSARLADASRKPVGEAYDGYVPDFMPGEHCGDYVELQIDLATGTILNWRPPTAAQLTKTFGRKPG